MSVMCLFVYLHSMSTPIQYITCISVDFCISDVFTAHELYVWEANLKGSKFEPYNKIKLSILTCLKMSFPSHAWYGCAFSLYFTVFLYWTFYLFIIIIFEFIFTVIPSRTLWLTYFNNTGINISYIIFLYT